MRYYEGLAVDIDRIPPLPLTLSPSLSLSPLSFSFHLFLFSLNPLCLTSIILIRASVTLRRYPVILSDPRRGDYSLFPGSVAYQKNERILPERGHAPLQTIWDGRLYLLMYMNTGDNFRASKNAIVCARGLPKFKDQVIIVALCCDVT